MLIKKTSSVKDIKILNCCESNVLIINEANKLESNEMNKSNENKSNENKSNENKSNENKSNENKSNENKSNENKSNENEIYEANENDENKANENDENDENEANENDENESNENESNENESNENESNENESNENESNVESYDYTCMTEDPIVDKIRRIIDKFICNLCWVISLVWCTFYNVLTNDYSNHMFVIFIALFSLYYCPSYELCMFYCIMLQYC
jgi:flagellar biosynthesis GTPase FlhF